MSKLSLDVRISNAIHSNKFLDALNLASESKDPQILFLKAYAIKFHKLIAQTAFKIRLFTFFKIM
jgi:hypothetical protein